MDTSSANAPAVTPNLAIEKAVESVVQIFVSTAMFDDQLLYRSPGIDSHSGSGFVVLHAEDGVMVLTNAHVAENALSIQATFPQTGKKKYTGRVVWFMPNSDVALVHVKTDLRPTEMKLADSLLCKRTDTLTLIGFPLGERQVQITSGTISGFTDGSRASYDGPRSSIQITTPSNPGSSGSAALNSDGDVVGILFSGVFLAQNVNYIIPINNVKAAMNGLGASDEQLVLSPRLGMKTNPNAKGLYVSVIKPSSIFYDEDYQDNLEARVEGCVARYYPKEATPNVLSVGDIIHQINIQSVGGKYEFVLDENGTSRLQNNERLFTLRDIGEMIDRGSDVELFIIRKGDLVKDPIIRTFEVKPVVNWMTRKAYRVLEKERFRSLFIGGMLLAENQFVLRHHAKGRKFHRKVEIMQLFRGSVFEDNAAKPGLCIDRINERPIFVLEDVWEAIKADDDKITIQIHGGALLQSPLDKLLASDEVIFDENQIPTGTWSLVHPPAEEDEHKSKRQRTD